MNFDNLKSLLVKTGKPVLRLITVILILTAGYLIGSRVGSPQPNEGMTDSHDHTAASKAEEQPQIWTCSMHPQIQSKKPGNCPICSMKLIPLKPDSASDTQNPRTLTLSDNAKKLAQIQTATVERRFVTRDIRLFGKIAYDETQLKAITAWFPGRIERLYVDYTGVRVNEQEHLARIYSPDLITAQSELISALRYDSSPEMITSAREKLRLMGLSPDQVAEIENRGKPQDAVDINAPMGGIVIERNISEGEYVKTGSILFRIADLSQIWVLLDAYEADLTWIRYGQNVTFSTEAVPGKVFKGTVAFINPMLDSMTRTVKVRVNAANPDGLLKPGVFARGTIHATMAADGLVATESFAGKWIGPMHPEIIRDGPGTCPICGMPLVRAEELGYVDSNEEQRPPLIIPATAVLQTGERAIVYVASSGMDSPTYEGREITLGARAGEYFIVENGLREGEQVVVNGNFKIDSALQILAKPSMMNPEEGEQPPMRDHGDMKMDMPMVMNSGGQEEHEAMDSMKMSAEPVLAADQVAALLEPYFAMQKALTKDNLEEAKGHAAHLLMTLKKVDMAAMSQEDHMAWMGLASKVTAPAQTISKAGTIVEARTAFEPLSNALTDAVKTIGVSGKYDVYHMSCPMAFPDHAATWLQPDDQLINPYLGSMMLQCGTVEEQLAKKQ